MRPPDESRRRPGAKSEAERDGPAGSRLAHHEQGVLAWPATASLCGLAKAQTRSATIEVITDSGPRRGETVIRFDADEASPLQVVVALDVTRLRELPVDRIGAGGHEGRA